MPFSSVRSSSFSRPSSSFKSSSSSFKSSSSTSKSSTSTTKSSSKSYSSGKKTFSLKKPETKKTTEQKSTTKTYKLHKPVSHTPVKEAHHYHHSSSALDWMPFMFMAEAFEDDEPVIIQDGKAVNQPQNNGFTGLDFLSLFLTLAIVAVFGWSIWRIFKKNKKSKRGWM